MAEARRSEKVKDVSWKERERRRVERAKKRLWASADSRHYRPAGLVPLVEMAEAYVRNPGKAERLLSLGLTLAKETVGMRHAGTVYFLKEIARRQQWSRKETQAQALLKKVLTIQKKRFGPRHPEVAAALEHLAEICEEQGRRDRAGLYSMQAETMRKDLRKEAKARGKRTAAKARGH